jgi:general secretion pathway protein A
VLIVDESQGLSPFVLEEIRLLSNFESDTAKHLQIVLTGQPELRAVLNYPDLRQLKQRVALRCTIKPLPNVEETDHYITSRLLVAGAERTDIFSPGAIDYIFRCSEGIPRNINNLCDNALLAGFAAGQPNISRGIIEEVAETFDMLPPVDRGMLTSEERETPARIFSASGRAELWAAGTGEKATSVEVSPATVPVEEMPPAPYAPPTDQSPIHLNQPPTTLDEVGAAFSRSGLVRDNNG